nr:transposase [Halosolutus halophilus]
MISPTKRASRPSRSNRNHSCPACGFEADRDANAVVRLRLTGSKIATRFCDGVEHSFSRHREAVRSRTLRINALRIALRF